MTEQAMIYVALNPLLGTNAADPNKGDNYVTSLENYVDGILPDEVRVTSATFWFDGAAPFSSSDIGNIVAMIDPQRKYCMRVGFPYHQAFEPQYLKVLCYRRLGLGEPNGVTLQLSPPVAYRKGDGLLIAPEYAGSLPILGSFLLLGIEATGNLSDLPQPTTLLNLNFDTPASGQPPTTARNIIPASVSPISKIRVRVASYEFHPSNKTIINHVSVGVRSGSTSSCVTIPVELKFSGESGIRLYQRQWVWSDWTDFPVLAGQELLVSASMFQPGNVNNWSFRSAPTGGPGVWAATGDSWNTAALQGSVSFYSGATSVIDMVQVQ